MESLPQNIQLDVEAACSTLLPERSKALYDKEYENFMKWKEENSLQSNTEEIFLAYFVQKSRKYKSSTLWAKYSMLKAVSNLHDKLDIGQYYKLTAFLKKEHVGYEAKKSLIQ